MSSRGKKKTGGVKTAAPSTATSTAPDRRKGDTRLNVVLTIGLILILLTCCLPTTGLRFETDLGSSADASGTSDGAASRIELSSALNVFTILAMPASEYSDWSAYLAHHMTADKGSITESIAVGMIENFFTQKQLRQLNVGMWAFFAVCCALIGVWAACAILFGLTRKFCKSTLPIVIGAWVLAALCLVQFVMLVVMFAMGQAGTTFIVNAAAWLLLILGIALAIYATVDYVRRARNDKETPL